MRIKNVLGLTLEEIQEQKFNIYLGISLGKEYFDDSVLTCYMDWMSKFTKDKIAFLIADSIHAVNFQIFNNLSIQQSISEAEQQGAIICDRLKRIISLSCPRQTDSIRIIRWSDIVASKDYLWKYEILTNEFENNDNFRYLIIKTIKSNLGSRCKGLSKDQYHQLSLYLLGELSAEINGLFYDETLFNLQIYPSQNISLFVQVRKAFPNLVEKLKINNTIGVIEGYAK